MEVYVSFTEKFELALSLCYENSAETQFLSILLFLCHQDIAHMIQACSLACLSVSWSKDEKGKMEGDYLEQLGLYPINNNFEILVVYFFAHVICLSWVTRDSLYLRFLSLRATRRWTCIIRSIAKAYGRRRVNWLVLYQQLNDFTFWPEPITCPDLTTESGIIILQWTVSEQS